MLAIGFKNFRIIVLLSMIFCVGITESFARSSIRRNGSNRFNSIGQIQKRKNEIRKANKKIEKPEKEPESFVDIQKRNKQIGFGQWLKGREARGKIKTRPYWSH